MSYRIGIDIGGTFTDFALLNVVTGKVATHKQLTTPMRPADAVLSGLDALFKRENVVPKSIDAVVHGTTLIANAVIERKGAKIGMITTAGFKDLIDMGLESRYDMFDLRIDYPKPLVARSNRVEVKERVRYDGSIDTAIDMMEVKIGITKLVDDQNIEALAVCLLHSYTKPEHEQKIRDLALELYPNLYVSISSEVFPDLREYSRWTTTCINAYTQPVFDRYLHEIEDGLKKLCVLAPLFIMASNGGTVVPDTARKFPVRALESGPAAGVLMSEIHGSNLLEDELLSFDMGGTTAKGALIHHGRAIKRYEMEVGRVHEFKQGSGLIAKIPVIDMIEIGSGGGSIAALDSRGLISVGPRSAGADPGPACYNLGGQNPTLTDANLVLGYLDENSFLGGAFRVTEAKAAEVIKRSVSDRLNLSLARAAWGIHDIVNEGIAKAFRIHASERGFDYRKCSMVAFGGSGPIHALEVAQKLKIPQVIFPVGAGVMSAFGLLASPLAFEVVQAGRVFLGDLSCEEFVANFDNLSAQVNATLIASGVSDVDITYTRKLDMRYSGQGYTIEVPIPEGVPLSKAFPQLLDLFATQYSMIYARMEITSPVEITTWKVSAVGPVPRFPVGYKTWEDDTVATDTKNCTRPVYFKDWDDYVTSPVVKRSSIQSGTTLNGPVIIEELESTVVVGPKFTVDADDNLNLIVQVGQS